MARLQEEVRAGIIVFSSLFILSVFIILIGGNRLFEQHDTYRITVNNTSGLLAGAPVKAGGVKIGRVLEIEEPEFPGDRISITFGIREGMPLFKGTNAVIMRDGFIGEVYLLLSPDSISDEKIRPGDMVQMGEKPDMNVLLAKVNRITNSVDTLLNNMNALLDKDMVDDMHEAVSRTRSVLTEIDDLVGGTKGELSGMLTDARKAVKQAEEMMRTIEKTADTSGGTIEKTAASVVKTTESVGNAVDAQSANAGELIMKLTETTEDLREFLQQIKNKPWSVIYREEGEKDD